VASKLTEGIPAAVNLLIVVLSVIIMVRVLVTVQAILEVIAKGDRGPSTEATLARYLHPMVEIAAWMIGIAGYVMTQFVGTTFTSYLRELPPHQANAGLLHEILPMTLLVLSSIGIALHIYRPYDPDKDE
jgi:Na+/proline symporter